MEKRLYMKYTIHKGRKTSGARDLLKSENVRLEYIIHTRETGAYMKQSS